MKNREIAAIFNEMADILEVKGDNPFKVRAYRRAVLTLEGLARPVEELSPEELHALPGIGEELAAKIGQYCSTGVIRAHEKLKAEVPAGLLQLLDVPGLGPKTVRLLREKGGIGNLDALEEAAREHRLAGIPGIGAKTEENILRGIAGLRRRNERRLPADS